MLPDPRPLTDSRLDCNSLMSLKDRPGTSPLEPVKESGDAHETQAEHVQLLDSEPSADEQLIWDHWISLTVSKTGNFGIICDL